MSGDTEREMVNKVEEFGWIALRAPASGSRPDSHTGDVWLVRENDTFEKSLTDLLVVEEKYRSSGYIDVDGDKADGMISMAEDAGGTPVLACRWNANGSIDAKPEATHYCVDMRRIDRTSSGNILVSPEESVEEFEVVEQFLQRTF